MLNDTHVSGWSCRVETEKTQMCDFKTEKLCKQSKRKQRTSCVLSADQQFTRSFELLNSNASRRLLRGVPSVLPKYHVDSFLWSARPMRLNWLTRHADILRAAVKMQKVVPLRHHGQIQLDKLVLSSLLFSAPKLSSHFGLGTCGAVPDAGDWGELWYVRSITLCLVAASVRRHCCSTRNSLSRPEVKVSVCLLSFIR